MTKQELFQIKLNVPDEKVKESAKKRWDSLAKPIDGFGDLETVVSRIAAIAGHVPSIKKRAAVIFCADNGIVEEGISQSPSDVTRTVARCLGNGSSTAAVLAKNAAVDVIPVDIGILGQEEIPGVLSEKVREGTSNFLREPAMSEDEVLRAIEAGSRLVGKLKEDGYEMLLMGEMGIGNTTTSAALVSALLDIDPLLVTGRGAGLCDEGLKKKQSVVAEGVKKYKAIYEEMKEAKNEATDEAKNEVENTSETADSSEYAFFMLQCLGGLDIAGLVGLCIGGAKYQVPIVIDGVITAAAALIAERMLPGVKEYLLASHKGRENGTMYVLNALGLTPILDGNMALGEGTGAILLMPVLDTILAYYLQGADFDAYGLEAYERMT